MSCARAVALLTLTLAACSNPERDELLNWIDDYEGERSSSRASLCICPELLGYASSDECEADEPNIGTKEQECVADVFEGNEDLGIDYYSCVTPALRTYGLCLIDNYGECVADWDEPCTSDYEAALAQCPTLSSNKAAAVFDCISG